MNVLAKTAGFSLFLIVLFTAVMHLLPQVENEPRGEYAAFDTGDMTMESFVAMGEALFAGRGTCSLCHNKLNRAPDLLAVNTVKTAQERITDPRYRGSAQDAEGYLRESMLEPDAFVVEGFGTKGTLDARSPMPASDEPPALLTTIEMDAIIAFLQNKDGNRVTVSLPNPGFAAKAAPPPESAAPAGAQTAGEALAKFGCGDCHGFGTGPSRAGPDLNDIGERLSVGQIREAIISPGTAPAEGYAEIMPDYSAQMTVGELEILVRFLAQPPNGNRRP